MNWTHLGLLIRLKWFCFKIRFCGDIRIQSSKNSTPRSAWYCAELKIKMLIKNVGLCCNSTHIILKICNILIEGKVRHAKTKLFPAKLWAVWYCAESDSSQYHTARSPTPHSVRHFWICGKLWLLTPRSVILCRVRLSAVSHSKIMF